MLDPQLRGKKALITGGATGIGLGIARALASEGVDLVIASRNPDADGLAQLRALHPRIMPLAVQLSDAEQAIQMVERAADLLGGLDYYVNNAAQAKHQPITQLTLEAWEQTLNTNLRAAVLATRETARLLIRQGHGSILIVGSTARLTPAYSEIAYRISKTGLKVLTENLALELAPWNIRVNMITPGHYPTRLTSGIAPEIEQRLKREIPLRRFGDPLEEVGAAAVLLLSDRLSGYTTGADLIIDGGLSLRPLNFWSEDTIRDFNG